MKNAYKLGLALFVLLGIAGNNVLAQENPLSSSDREFSKIGVGSGSFLSLPVGARAIAMGSSFSGISDDASALYWNPAGIASSTGTNVEYSFGAYFAGITHNFAGATFPVGESYVAGISANSFGTGDIEVTNLFDQEGTGEVYTVRDMALGLSLGGQLTDQFGFGVTAKYVSLGIGNATASGVAFDVGTLYEPGFLDMKIGFAVQNLSTPLKYEGSSLVLKGGVSQTTGNRDPDTELEASEASLPLTFRAGVGSNIMRQDEHSLVASGEFSTSSDAPEHLGLGVEYTWDDLIAARVGYQFGSDDAFGPSAGIGIKYDSGPLYAMLDYAIRPHASIGLVNIITASIRLN